MLKVKDTDAPKSPANNKFLCYSGIYCGNTNIVKTSANGNHRFFAWFIANIIFRMGFTIYFSDDAILITRKRLHRDKKIRISGYTNWIRPIELCCPIKASECHNFVRDDSVLVEISKFYDIIYDGQRPVGSAYSVFLEFFLIQPIRRQIQTSV